MKSKGKFLKVMQTTVFAAGLVWGQTVTQPEPMSGKTVLQFFADEEIKAGWNLGNTLDAYNDWQLPVTAIETAWGNPVATQQLFNGVKQSGFDMVRIPCTWLRHIGAAPDYTISSARLQRVEEVVNYAKNAGIKAIVINIHHDGANTNGDQTTVGFVDMPAAVGNAAKKMEIENQIAKVWSQIAEYFKNYGDYLIFERELYAYVTGQPQFRSTSRFLA
ncbi:MAG: glycoside hydrolase family 5 protein [Chitinispirillales bacterium]|jgi:endoglucanase|nr:glycoside hydrolase family 5 protein [Chitinispirillales bacterium]